MNSILQPAKDILIIFSVFITLVTASCNKKFDEPPLNADPDIPVTMTIAELKGRYAKTGDFQKVEDDKVISGIVTADDRTGNFFRQIVIQDETGGIPLIIDMTSIYTMYPAGRRVYIKLKGLMLGDYGGTIQLGLDSTRSPDGRFLNLGRIPEALLDTYIAKGSFGNTVAPRIVKPSDFSGSINDPLLSLFVQINNAELRDADLVRTYANAASPTTESARNFTIKPCDDTKSIVLRNSSYATFAGLPVPQRNGALTGIASVFNGTVQLTIRDTSDVQFNGTRCSGQVPVAVTKTIAEVLQYAKGDSLIPAGIWIEGIIISDTKNESAGNYRLQDGSAGIQIRFAKDANPTPGALGDKLKVYVGGYRFSQFNGGLQIEGPDVSETTGTGAATPRVATVAEVLANLRAWESTVVTINNVTFVETSPTGTGKSYSVTDATGTLSTFVRTTSGIVMPNTATSVTGYVSVFQSTSPVPIEVAQITLRTPADIVGGVTVPPDFGPFTATYNFASVTNATGTTDPTPPPTVLKLTFTNFVAVGVGANSSAGGRFSFSGWPAGATNGSDAFTGAIDVTKYYEITIAPADGAKLDLSKLTFTLQRSSTGIRQVVVRSSVDNFAGNLAASIEPATANLSVVATNIFQIADAATTAENGSTITFGSSHANLSVPVKIRFYGFNSESSGGTFSIDNVVIEGTTKSQ